MNTAVLGFKDGGNSLSSIVLILSLEDGTDKNIGKNIKSGETHRITWNASKDWNTDFGNIQFEILTKDDRNLIDLDFTIIPTAQTDPSFKIVRTPVQNDELLSTFLWLIATQDPDVRLQDAQIFSTASNQVLVNNQDQITDDGVAFVMNNMGLRIASDAELARAKTFGTFWTWVMPTGNN